MKKITVLEQLMDIEMQLNIFMRLYLKSCG
jgi:hypothetical protein